jgi:DHA2 family multidrug resistance protein-like MFS transporter
MAIAALGLLSLVWLPEELSFADMAWRLALCGLGFSLFFSPNGRLVVGSVPREQAAGASSLVSTTRMFGQALGSTALAGLLALGLGAMMPVLAAVSLALAGLVCNALRIVVHPDRERLSAGGLFR